MTDGYCSVCETWIALTKNRERVGGETVCQRQLCQWAARGLSGEEFESAMSDGGAAWLVARIWLMEAVREYDTMREAMQPLAAVGVSNSLAAELFGTTPSSVRAARNKG